MKIKQYTFDWLDKRDGKNYHAVKYGKFGEEWRKCFDEHPDVCELKTCEEKEILLKKGMEFISPWFDGWVLVIDICSDIELPKEYEDLEEVHVRDVEINGTGEGWWHYHKEELEHWLDWHNYELKEVA